MLCGNFLAPSHELRAVTTVPGRTLAHRSWRTSVFASPSTVLDMTMPITRWRRTLTWSLGLIWLLDAALQYQPFMFTTAFPKQVIEPTAQGNPGWVHGPVLWAAHLTEHHIVIANAVFATVQLVLALGMFSHRTVRAALAASIVWAVLVWWLGTGLGGLLAGPVMPILGLPGAVIIYAFIALLVWPPSTPDSIDGKRSVAASSPLGSWGARGMWVVLWALFVFETLRPANRSPSALHDAVTAAASGEPGWLKSINNQAAKQLGARGTLIVVVLTIVFTALALCVFLPATTRVVLILGIVVCLTFWIAAEDIGTIATGNATDPNSGLPLILLLLCYWPIHRPEPPSRLPATND